MKTIGEKIILDKDYESIEKLDSYIEKLSRPELIALLKWEIQNRFFLEERLKTLNEK